MSYSTACPDWERRIVARESLIALPPLYPALAEEAWDVCGSFKLVDVMGEPLLRDASLPWLRDFVKAVFGAESPEGRRLINTFFLMVSKKNAKSTVAAAIMLGALIMNWRRSAELLILSPTKEIADNSYKPISTMVKADPELESILKVQDHCRTVTHLGTGATLKVVAADSDTVSGKKASFVFVDELHEFGKRAKASNMLLEATGGLASRPEGFVIYATTQSEEPPAGVFKTKLDYARKVRDGEVVDTKFLPLIYEFPRAMLERKQHEILANAYVTNPNWGASVDIERITQLHSEAKTSGEKEFKEFLAKHLNVEIGLNLRSDRWPGADFWLQQGVLEQTFSLTDLIERSEVITMGGDGGGLDDLLGQYAIGRCKKTRKWLGWAHAWAHPSVLDRRKEIAPRLQDFARDGHLTLVKHIGEDADQFAANVALVYDSGLLDKLGVDPQGIGAILDAIESNGVPADKVIGISQGYKLMSPMKTVERKLAEGVFEHSAQPVMAWCVGNAKIVQSGNAVLITKQASGTGKIDPLMAMLNAAYLMSLNPETAPKPQIFVLDLE